MYRALRRRRREFKLLKLRAVTGKKLIVLSVHCTLSTM